MRKNPFRGLGVALITPFLPTGDVDEDALRHIVSSLVTDGVDFLCVLGTTAETSCLTPDERRLVAQVVRDEVAQRIPLLLGIGSNCTADVVNRLKTENFEGFDGFLVVCPFYNKPTQEGMFQHFKAVAAATDMPIVLYNVPGRTGANLEAATTLRIANACPNVVAIKEASALFGQIEEIIDNAPEGFEVLSGDDAITFEWKRWM